MAYVDGYLVPVKTAHREAYRKAAEEVGAIFLECGALRVVECWGEDVPEGKRTSFPMAVKRTPDETVVFSWVEWASKEARDAGNARLLAHPGFQHDESEHRIMDPKRLVFGGFVPMIDLRGDGA